METYLLFRASIRLWGMLMSEPNVLGQKARHLGSSQRSYCHYNKCTHLWNRLGAPTKAEYLTRTITYNKFLMYVLVALKQRESWFYNNVLLSNPLCWVNKWINPFMRTGSWSPSHLRKAPPLILLHWVPSPQHINVWGHLPSAQQHRIPAFKGSDPSHNGKCSHSQNYYSFIHMCIHCLGHFSPLPQPPLSSPLPLT
jgi:hypothetical protein